MNLLIFAAFGGSKFRMKWIERVETASYRLTTTIHPFASVSPSAIIELGVIIEGNAVVKILEKVKEYTDKKNEKRAEQFFFR